MLSAIYAFFACFFISAISAFIVFISSASFSSHSSRVLAYTFLDRDFSIECYKVAKKTPDGIDYEITIDGKNGYATVAMTKYYDGTEEPTLPINLGTHSIYFYAE